MSLFKHYYGTKKHIQDHEIQNGLIYFSTDSLQKFVDINNQRIQISDQYMDESLMNKIIQMRMKLAGNDSKLVPLTLIKLQDNIANVQADDIYTFDDETGILSL